MHAHGPVAEPRPGGEPHSGHLDQRLTLVGVEPFVHVPGSTGLDGVDDPVEVVAQESLGVHAHREHVRDRHRRADHVGHVTVPHPRGVLGGPHRAVTAAAAAVEVAVGAVLAVHLCREDPGVLGRGRVGAVRGDRRVHRGPRRARLAAAVRLQEVRAAGDREADLVLLAGRALGQVLAVGHRCDVLEEPAAVLVLRGQVDREAGVGAREAAVEVAVASRRVPPLVDVDVRGVELVATHAARRALRLAPMIFSTSAAGRSSTSWRQARGSSRPSGWG